MHRGKISTSERASEQAWSPARYSTEFNRPSSTSRDAITVVSPRTCLESHLVTRTYKCVYSLWSNRRTAPCVTQSFRRESTSRIKCHILNSEPLRKANCRKSFPWYRSVRRRRRRSHGTFPRCSFDESHENDFNSSTLGQGRKTLIATKIDLFFRKTNHGITYIEKLGCLTVSSLSVRKPQLFLKKKIREVYLST